MAFVSVSKPYHLNLKPSRISIHLHFFTTTQDPTQDLNNAPPQQQEQHVPNNRRTPRGKTRNPEKVEDIICRMMENRAWTTRLQNSIRALVLEFDHALVYNVLHGAKNSDHALQFFRWVERAGLIHHDREAHLKIIQILGRASKLNHARCILLDMPSHEGLEIYQETLVKALVKHFGARLLIVDSLLLPGGSTSKDVDSVKETSRAEKVTVFSKRAAHPAALQ